MSGESLMEQLTELLLSQLKSVASDEDDLKRREAEVTKLGGALSKFKRAKQVGKLIEKVRPFMESLPNFYADFYYIMTPKICYTSYASKFFDLVDVILSSSHVPVYVIAAYAKKLSRILLTAPLNCQIPIITLIKNILHRHKIVHKMLVNREIPDSCENDPYDENERDLTKCGAKDSSLWEIRSIQQHWFYKVSEKANFIDRPAQDDDVPLSWQSNDDIFSILLKRSSLKLKQQAVDAKERNRHGGDLANEGEERQATEGDELEEELLLASSDEENEPQNFPTAKRPKLGNNDAEKTSKLAERPLVNPLYHPLSSGADAGKKILHTLGLAGGGKIWAI